MKKLTTQSQPRWVLVYASLLALPVTLLFALPLNQASSLQIAIALTPAAFALGFFWIELVKAKRKVHIDAEANVVLVEDVSLLLISRSVSFPLSDFGYVGSYLFGVRSQTNYVALIAHDRQHGVVLAEFAPSPGSKRFFDLPSDAESALAKGLREHVAVCCAVRDVGFLGRRAPFRMPPLGRRPSATSRS